MNYEEKFKLVVDNLVEAQKMSRQGQPCKLFTTKGSEIVRQVIPHEIHEILLQLQDDEKVVVLSKIPSELKSGWDVDVDKIEYFEINTLDNFDQWLDKYLIKQASRLTELTYINLLRLYDTMMAISEKIQLTKDNTVTIPLVPNRIYFNQLFPADTPGTRDEYMAGRWELLVTNTTNSRLKLTTTSLV